jgi:LacI family transcriptional regulator
VGASGCTLSSDLIDEHGHDDDQANPFYSSIARGVEEVAAEHGYLVITGNSKEHAAREHDLVSTLCRQHVAGLLVVPARHRVGSEREARIPTVFLDRPSPAGCADTVLLDNIAGARRGVAYLIAQGHRRIGVVGDGQTLYTALERLRGYRAALAEAGIAHDDALLSLGAQDTAAAEDCAYRLLEHSNPPSAIFALNNRACVGVLRAVTARRATVAVVGFDDLELADMITALQAVVMHDPMEMGREGARLLFARLSGHEGPWRSVVLPTSLMVFDRHATAATDNAMNC